MDEKWIAALLEKYKDVPFVQRILRTDNYEPLKLGDGLTGTHLMEYGEADGKAWAYPTIIMGEDGKLKRLESKAAWEDSRKRNNAIPFDTKEEADYFTKNYKSYWKRREIP